MIKTESISYTYDGNLNFNFPDIHLSDGGSLLVLGNSGVGKTTFLQILAGLLKSESGKVQLGNTNYNDLSANEMDYFRGANIGVIFQKSYFVRTLNIFENLKLSLVLSNKKYEKNNIINLLEDIGLGDKLYSMPYDLSQGEQQRAAIASAVIKNPELILADEPTSSLDDDNCQKTISLLKKQADKNKSKLIIITHDNRIKNQFNNSITL